MSRIYLAPPSRGENVRLRGLSPVLVLCITACSGGDESAEIPIEQPVVEAAPTEEEATEVPEEVPLEGIEAAHALMDSSSFAEAITLLESLLAEDPANVDTWKKLLRAGLASEAPEELLDRLDAATAIGGMNVLHFRLRAELALNTNRPLDAVEAARKIQDEKPEIAAALIARAFLSSQGIEPIMDTSALDAKVPTDALILAAAAPKSRRARLLNGMEYVHWQARLVYADLVLSAGKRAEAIATWTDLVDRAAEGSRASYLANIALSQHVDDSENIAKHLATAARIAASFPDGKSATSLLGDAVEAYLEGLDPWSAMDLAREMHEARVAAEDTRNSLVSGLLLAQTAWMAGHAHEALETARNISISASETGDTETAESAAWIQGLAAWDLRLDTEIADAATRGGDRADVLNALVPVLSGEGADSIKVLQTANLPGPSGVRIALAASYAAWTQGEDALSQADSAVKLANKSAHLPSQVEALLEQERYARAAGKPAARVARRALDSIARSLGDGGDPLRAEIATRRFVAGEKPGFPTGETFQAWNVLAGNAELPAAAKDEHPILGWARARQQVTEGDIDTAIATYTAAVTTASAHLRGPWTPVSMLDGRTPPAIARDLAMLAKSNHENAGLAGIVLHDWWHQAASLDAGFGLGDDPSTVLAMTERTGLEDAHRQVRSRTIYWLTGGEPVSSEEVAALDAAHAKAMETPAFARSMPTGTIDYSKLRSQLTGHAILSFRLGAAAGDAISITQDGTHVRQLTNPVAIRSAAVGLRNSLLEGTALGGEQTPAVHGDLLRNNLLSIFRADLERIGRYLVIPDGPLWGFSFNVIPEQQDGRRFLADIRSVGAHLSVSDAFRTPPNAPFSYSPDFLGLAPGGTGNELRADGLRVLGEMVNAARQFGQGLRASEQGDKATLALFRDKASTARYIHIADYSVGSRASLALADGNLDLSEIRGMDLVAQTVTLSTNTDPRSMMRQAQAFSSAGAANLVLSTWLVDDHIRGKYLYNFYEARNRERTPVRALAEARDAIQTGGEVPKHFDPSWWGQFTLYGRP